MTQSFLFSKLQPNITESKKYSNEEDEKDDSASSLTLTATPTARFPFLAWLSTPLDIGYFASAGGIQLYSSFAYGQDLVYPPVLVHRS